MAILAPSLVSLRAQLNAMAPGRSKAADGWIGDAAHAARSSRHNPNAQGVVCAIDITHDPAGGMDNWWLREALRASEDPRIGVVISMGQIFSSTATSARPAWTWGRYTGANRHDHHLHVDVHSGGTRAGLWNLSRDYAGPVRPTHPVSPVEDDDMPLTTDEIERIAKRAAEHVWGVDSGGYSVGQDAKHARGGADLANAGIKNLTNGVLTLIGRTPASAIDVDEKQLAAELAPLLTTAVRSLSDTDLQRIADAVVDEQANRLKES